MNLKFLLVTILYQLVISEQKTVEKIALDSAQIQELNNLLTQLESQIDKEHKIHQHSEKLGKGIVEGNDVLNLLLQRDHYDKDRSDEGVLKYKDDRDCMFGRCGCSRGRCGDNRAESSSDEVTNLLDSLEKTIDKDMAHDHARCGRGRCGYGRYGKSNGLRCKGGRCGKTKDDLDNRDDVPSLRAIKQELEKYGKSYKLNNNLDVVVLNAGNVENTVKELNKKCNNYANCKVLDYSKAKSTLRATEENDINAVVLDLSHLPDSNDLAKELNNILAISDKSDDNYKDHLSPDDLDRYYQNYKNIAFNDVVRYVKDKSGRRELSVKYLSGKQKQLIEDVKTLLLKGGIGLNDKNVVKQIEKILFGKDSSTKIYHHDEHNRNIYVPKYLYDRIEKSKTPSNLGVQKRLLPLTLQQRHRLLAKPVHSLRRKSVSEGYGVPFDFQVQGLGQPVP